MKKKLIIEVRRGQEVIQRLQWTGRALLTVGRSEDCDIVLSDPTISRRHAKFNCTNEGIRVCDLSRNGISVDCEQIPEETTLPYGTLIQIGTFAVFIEDTKPQGLSPVEIKNCVHKQLVDKIDLNAVGDDSMALRSRVEIAVERLLDEKGLAAQLHRPSFIREIADEALGLGPLEELLADDRVSEIMVVGPDAIFVERSGTIESTQYCFSSEKALRNAIERIIAPLGRRIDEASPTVDARLADGSRVHAIIPPLSLRGPCLTIRKFSRVPLTLDDLVGFGSIDTSMGELLVSAVKQRQNIVISGGTGSGKTTLLRILADQIPAEERILTIEDAAEINLDKPHVVPLESRPNGSEGNGEISIRELVRNALRMRPDRIVVGECRGGEALDMLQAMNTGHDGSLTTIHANSPKEAITRLETLCLMAGLDLPARAIREQISQAVDLIVQQTRFSDGKRRIVDISEVTGVEPDGTVGVRRVHSYLNKHLKTKGRFAATGWLPAFYRTETGESELSQ